MILLPTTLLLLWLIGLLAIGLLLAGVYLLSRAFRRRRVARTVYPTEPGRRPMTALVENEAGISPIPLALGLFLLLWVFTGRYWVSAMYPAGPDDPRPLRSQSVQSVDRPDGSVLHVENFGPANGPILVLTHGWGADNDEWYYAKRDLAQRYRLVTWDLPGLGSSRAPNDGDYSLDKLAEDLHAVVQTTGDAPVVLVGHSIGGMINLTYTRRYPDQFARKIAGIAQLNTTYTNPARTTSNAETNQSLQKPVGEPLLHATIVLSPLVRVMNWLAYQSGLVHLQLASSSFAGSETRGQLDFVARYYVQSSPAVVARGTLGMLHWDATDALKKVRVPVLIIAGDQDTTTVPAASEQMRAAIPRADLTKISPAAHLGPVEQNARYNEEISRFAARCLSPQSASLRDTPRRAAF